MKRRDFVAAAAVAAGLPLAARAQTRSTAEPGGRQLIEWREYHLRFRGGGRDALLAYYRDAFVPALQAIGVERPRFYRDLGDEQPTRVYVAIAYPDAETYLQAQLLGEEPDFLEASETYRGIPADRPLYERFTSSLLLAFAGMPTVADPGEEAGLFELRLYEGYSEDAVRRKVMMFNEEEIDLFHRVGLHPVFFGEAIAGPLRPNLTYLLHFRDMEERDANWDTFIQHPEWKTMSGLEKYRDTVSNIRRRFLLPLELG